MQQGQWGNPTYILDNLFLLLRKEFNKEFNAYTSRMNSFQTTRNLLNR